MGILSSLFGSKEEEESSSVTHPCTNCESDCKICPDACEECSPYKKQLVDLLYNVENIDAFRAKYEVVSQETANVGSSTCPACGASNPITLISCEYCGTALRESNGKILVTSANDIPNPILEAQELIYQRHAMIKRYTGTESSESTGILGAISSLLGGDSGSSASESDSLGSRMSEDEIKSAAEYYNVSVSSYLQGLDNGKYLTYDRMKQQSSGQTSGSSYAAGALGLGAGTVIGSQMGQNHRPPRPPQGNQQGGWGNQQGQPPRPPQGQRPASYGQQGGPGGNMSRPGQNFGGGNRPSAPGGNGGNRSGQPGAQRRDSGSRGSNGADRGPDGRNSGGNRGPGGRGPGR